MDRKNLVPIPLGLSGQVYRSPMPFAAFDDGKTTFSEYLDAKINTVVMLTEVGEDLRHAGKDLAQTYADHQIETVRFPITDFDTPEDHSSLLDTLDEVLQRAERGENIAVHCFAGRGRTGLFIALLARKVLNLEGQEAIDWVRKIFPAIETQEQEQLVQTLDLER